MSHHYGTFNWDNTHTHFAQPALKHSQLKNSLQRATCLLTYMSIRLHNEVSLLALHPVTLWLSLNSCLFKKGLQWKQIISWKNTGWVGQNKGGGKTIIIFTTYKEEKLVETKQKYSLYFTVIVFFLLMVQKQKIVSQQFQLMCSILFHPNWITLHVLYNSPQRYPSSYLGM